jgi:succinoglycan biosynthesis transport protein ExoP
MNERSLHPIEYLLIFKRRKAWFIIPFVVCSALGIALALVLPATYKSEATIGVQAPAVSTDLVSARTTLDREERLRALSQQLRSPAVLERVAREENLVSERPIAVVTQELNQRINVDLPRPIARTDGQPELNAFFIVYRDRTPERTQRIANRLALVFVDEHLRSREMQAEGTAEFLGAQLRASEERISNLEARLRAAKELHMGKLPEQTAANLGTVAGIRQQLEGAINNMRWEQDRLTLIERQMQSMRQGVYAAPIGTGGILASPQQRVAALQNELAAARGKYTDKHPEIQILEDELKAARAEVAAIGKRSDTARQELLNTDPAYQVLETERNQTQLRIRAYQRAQAQLQSDIARYQRAVDAAPMVEQELAGVQREYNAEQANQKTLSERHTAALLQEQIARTRGGERFSVLNGAYLPKSPESPNRLRLALVALALGLGLGGAMVFGREYLDWSIRDPRAVQDQFDLPVLAEIPRIRDVA